MVGDDVTAKATAVIVEVLATHLIYKYICISPRIKTGFSVKLAFCGRKLTFLPLGVNKCVYRRNWHPGCLMPRAPGIASTAKMSGIKLLLKLYE